MNIVHGIVVLLAMTLGKVLIQLLVPRHLCAPLPESNLQHAISNRASMYEALVMRLNTRVFNLISSVL